jgi:hypothetical protein
MAGDHCRGFAGDLRRYAQHAFLAFGDGAARGGDCGTGVSYAMSCVTSAAVCAGSWDERLLNKSQRGRKVVLSSSTKATSFLIPILCMLASTTAGATPSPGYTSLSKISNSAASAFGLDIDLPDAGNRMECAWGGRFRIPLGATNYETMVAYLLSAAARSVTVTVYTNACDASGISVITAVQGP